MSASRFDDCLAGSGSCVSDSRQAGSSDLDASMEQLRTLTKRAGVFTGIGGPGQDRP